MCARAVPDSNQFPASGENLGTYNDRISITGIHARGVHGVLESEHHQPQDFYVDVSLWFDSRVAAATDDLTVTVNYAEVTTKVLNVVSGESVALIERLANRIAMSVLSDERISAVQVTVHKPQAPLPVEFTDVSVQVLRTRRDFQAQTLPTDAALTESPAASRSAVLGLGANLNHPVDTLREVAAALSAEPEFESVEISPLVRSRPVLAPGQVTQPDYYNAVVRVVSRLSAYELLLLARRLEDAHGRERPYRWAPRVLDVDVISVDGIQSRDPVLTLPHPRAAQRAFVLVPWAALDPNATLNGEQVSQLAKRCNPDDILETWQDWMSPDFQAEMPR